MWIFPNEKDNVSMKCHGCSLLSISIVLLSHVYICIFTESRLNLLQNNHWTGY